MTPASLPLPVQTFGLPMLSNVFMTFAWYARYLCAALCLLEAVYFIFRG